MQPRSDDQALSTTGPDQPSHPKEGMGSLPLAGIRILVPRAAGQSGSTAQAIGLAGGVAFELPVIAVAAPPDPDRVAEAIRNLPTYDLVVFTSENAVLRVFAEMETQGRSHWPSGAPRIASIGTGTEAALARCGAHADIVPSVFIGEALAEAILEDTGVHHMLPFRRPRVLIPRALVARNVLPDRLREAGCAVDVVPFYLTQTALPARREGLVDELAAMRIDCVLLTSPSVVNGLVDGLGANADGFFDGVLLASIGPITTAAARERGLSVGLTAAEHSLPGLLSAVAEHFAGSGSSAHRS